MHIKTLKIKGNKESGYILLQSLVILMVIVCISALINKIIQNNYLKRSVIYTSDDVRTLTRIEEEVLNKAQTHFENNSTPYKKELKITGEKARKLTVVISGSDGELIKDDGYGNHSHIKLECNITNVSGSKVVLLKPKLYRTEYIYRCICRKT